MALYANIFHLHDSATTRTGDTGAGHSTTTNALFSFSALGKRAFGLWHVFLHAKDNACFVSVWLHGQHYSFFVLLAQPVRFEQRDGGAAVLAGDGARPEIGDGRL